MIYLYDPTRIDDLKANFSENKKIDITHILSHDFTNLVELEDICSEVYPFNNLVIDLSALMNPVINLRQISPRPSSANCWRCCCVCFPAGQRGTLEKIKAEMQKRYPDYTQFAHTGADNNGYIQYDTESKRVDVFLNDTEYNRRSRTAG